MANLQTPVYRLTKLSIATFLFGAFFTAANAVPTKSTAAVVAPSNGVVTIQVGEPGPIAPSAGVSTSAGSDILWNDIKDYTAEMRSQFLAGLQRMEAKVSIQYSELNAKRASARNTAAAKKLDQALNELGTAQFFLKTMGELLSRATPQTWEQQKSKVGLAWMKAQEAYFNAKTNPAI